MNSLQNVVRKLVHNCVLEETVRISEKTLDQATCSCVVDTHRLQPTGLWGLALPNFPECFEWSRLSCSSRWLPGLVSSNVTLAMNTSVEFA